ncbi:Aste57867_4593 [Aphanomyces stellatus]|uniref:Aste57867_4593 protein n=1 Tax=Aphanomyces stellatus TaxID=120398 RepID=A0A485KBM8_9STRA|nr:hypothetical protein As57867_004580 [Aphanomyces stellatus]VFT81698.1 Aste57867_4593 [Aphanomyces stellatus]
MVFSVTKSAILAVCLSLLALSSAQDPFFDSDGDTESICNEDDSKNFVCYKASEPMKIRTAAAVARLKVGSQWCTGWLFGSEGHIITNNHCVPNDDVAAITIVEFDSITPGCDDIGRKGSHPGRHVANSTKLLANDVNLDYALLQLNLNAGMDLSAYGYLQAREAAATLNENAYVISHAGGFPKRIAMVKDNNAPGRITTTSYTEPRPTQCHSIDRLGHNLDTEGGSSGAPLLAAGSNLVLGLHNCGGCRQGTQEYGSNYAVKITQVVDSLRGKNLLPKDAVAGAVRPPATTTTTVAPTKCSAIEDNVDYAGFDVASTQRTSASDCCADCESTSGCKLFVWSNFNGGTCWLKSHQGTKSTVRGAKAAVLHKDNQPGQCTPEADNFDFEGNDIASTARPASGDCCADCAATPGCKVYVWSAFNGGMCWLKSAKGAKRFAFGARAASISSGDSSSCSAVEKETDYAGEDVAEARGSLESCCDTCKANDACHAYSWANGVCYLKGKRAGATRNANVHSGRVYKCAAVEANVDYVGHDVAAVQAEAAEDCCAICRGYATCKAFSFAHGTCYLKSAKGETKAGNGVFSASA